MSVRVAVNFVFNLEHSDNVALVEGLDHKAPVSISDDYKRAPIIWAVDLSYATVRNYGFADGYHFKAQYLYLCLE